MTYLTNLLSNIYRLRLPGLMLVTSCVFLIVYMGPVAAETESDSKPEKSAKTFITELSNELEGELQKARQEDGLSDDAYLDKLIEKQILPYLDVPYMARKIGDAYWNKIKEKNLQSDMQDAVVNALKRTYRVALASYSGEKIMITHSKKYADYSLVRIEIATDNNTHKLDFALRAKNAQWKVFDVSVDGVVFSRTMQKSLKSQFENKSIEEVIDNLNGKPIT